LLSVFFKRHFVSLSVYFMVIVAIVSLVLALVVAPVNVLSLLLLYCYFHPPSVFV